MFNPYKYELYNFFTLDDFFFGSPVTNPWEENPQERLLDILDAMNYSPDFVELEEGELVYVDDIYKNLINLVYQVHHNDYAIATTANAVTQQEIYEFVYKFCGLIISTEDRYLALLKSYVAAKDKLLAPLKTTSNSSNRFNDTPQNGGDYSGDPFTSAINQIASTTEIDSDTIMGRLRELQGNYRNVLRDWVDEFNKLFVKEDNIE